MEMTHPESLAEKTLRCIGISMNNPQASSFPEIIRLVHTLSQNRNNITVGELAALVEKDAKMLVKVLQLSNSINYNVGKIKITTVTQAIQMVGFNCVCSIAMATMLLEQCTNQGSEEQKEASAMALCAGTLAKAVPCENADPDLAFICASLRLFGRIAMATVMPQEYAEARGYMAYMSESQAFEKAFGMKEDALCAALLEQNKVPEDIVSIIKGKSSDPVAVISDFAAQLSSLVCNPRLSAAEFATETDRLTSSFANSIPGVEAQLKTIIGTTGEELQELKKSFGITSLPAIFVERLKGRATDKPRAETPRVALKVAIVPAAGTGYGSASQPSQPTSSSSRPKEPPKPTREMELLLDLSEEIKALILKKADVDEVCGVLMDTMQSVFAATESCLFLGDATGLKIVHGAGRAWRKLRQEAVVTMDERSVFGVCLTRNTIVLIHDTATALHIPAWLKATSLFGAFAALPMKGLNQQGIILVGWTQTRKIVQTTEQSDLIKQILAETADYLGK
jgi:HD-like signal output (HDOD) protein